MSILRKFFARKKTQDNNDICAIADGELFEITKVNDPVFSEKMMGDGVAFRFESEKVTLCSPAEGTLSVLFPTGHAFGITMRNGTEVLVHCGINTVEANGDGFTILNKKQGDSVCLGDPIVEVNLKKLGSMYDMSTMLIVTKTNLDHLEFISPQKVNKGNSIVNKS